MGTICPKCHYERTPEDKGPEEECPSCGVIYAKAVSSPAQRKLDRPLPSSWVNEPPALQAVAPEQQSQEAEQLQQANITTTIRDPSRSSLLNACEACHEPFSTRADKCPKCNHPNPFAPRTSGHIAGMIALSLSISGLFMPYFAAVFLVPAAYTASAISITLRARLLPAIAIAIAIGGTWNIYQISKQIKETASQAQREFDAARRALENFR